MKLVYSLAFVLISSPAIALTVNCQADNIYGKGAKVKVPVEVTTGAQESAYPAPKVAFGGKELSAHYRKGDRYDTQSTFSMSIGDVTSIIYDVKLESKVGPINVISQGETRFQCWVE